ncbi:hypothetical protein BU23DRAFT_642529 [Bimuria novae-zelandiae CBS 107.79]|uniref:Uncharacterized protein n=1 Tax=Bimuria novae-zelandiae CBS 107.79 TaxID=1447943 RepID=A0A6A5VU62_9PLEO|nr:hypothetical protein BU23DRAFT_642529 [Bimuria novae-zelandiae CBS 107.79]
MTTYFFQHLDGSAYGRVMDNPAPICNPYHEFETGQDSYAHAGPYLHYTGSQTIVSSNMYRYDSGDEGASNEWDIEWHETDDGYYSESAQSPTMVEYVSYGHPGGFSNGATADPSLNFQDGGDVFRYTDPELIRGYHTLHSLLPHIQPARLQNSHSGPTLDIVEEQTNHKFAIRVPKKMLVLFCGREMISRFIRTLERKDNENWKGGPLQQELRFPCRYTNHIGIKILISWMAQACRRGPGEMKPVRIPKNLFAAISLSRALAAFRLYLDANRVDNCIAARHYKRSLYLDEIISIWNCLPKDSRYTYRMVEDLRKQRCEYEQGNEKALLDAKKVLQFLEQHPELKARVDDKEYNDREEFQPFFGTEWCVRAALHTQQTLTGMTKTADDDTPVSMNDGEPTVSGNAKNTFHANGVPRLHRLQTAHPRNDQKNARQQVKKQTMTLSDWKPQPAPTAWPAFEKTIVLNVKEDQEKTPNLKYKKVA